MKPNEYTIRTVKDFENIPAHRLRDCLADFEEWLQVIRNNPLVSISGVDKSDLVVDEGAFLWIDDGVFGISAVEFVEAGNGSSICRMQLQNTLTRDS